MKNTTAALIVLGIGATAWWYIKKQMNQEQAEAEKKWEDLINPELQAQKQIEAAKEIIGDWSGAELPHPVITEEEKAEMGIGEQVIPINIDYTQTPTILAPAVTPSPGVDMAPMPGLEIAPIQIPIYTDLSLSPYYGQFIPQPIVQAPAPAATPSPAPAEPATQPQAPAVENYEPDYSGGGGYTQSYNGENILDKQIDQYLALDQPVMV